MLARPLAACNYLYSIVSELIRCLKLMRKSKNRYFHHIFVSPGDAHGAITLNVVSMKREFDDYKLSRSMYASIFNSFPVIRTASAKKSPFSRTAAHIFVSPGDAPVTITQYVYMFYGWKDNSMLAKPLAACTYLSSIVSELYTMLKSMRKSNNRYFTTFLFPLGTPLGKSR